MRKKNPKRTQHYARRSCYVVVSGKEKRLVRQYSQVKETLLESLMDELGTDDIEAAEAYAWETLPFTSEVWRILFLKSKPRRA